MLPRKPAPDLDYLRRMPLAFCGACVQSLGSLADRQPASNTLQMFFTGALQAGPALGLLPSPKIGNSFLHYGRLWGAYHVYEQA
jgi:hypothetical protein